MKQITNMRQDIHRDWLREMRITKGDSMAETAEAVGVSTNYLAEIEHGRRNPSAKLALKLAEYFGFEVERIIKDAVPIVQRGQSKEKQRA